MRKRNETGIEGQRQNERERGEQRQKEGERRGATEIQTGDLTSAITTLLAT